MSLREHQLKGPQHSDADAYHQGKSGNGHEYPNCDLTDID